VVVLNEGARHMNVPLCDLDAIELINAVLTKSPRFRKLRPQDFEEAKSRLTVEILEKLKTRQFIYRGQLYDFIQLCALHHVVPDCKHRFINLKDQENYLSSNDPGPLANLIEKEERQILNNAIQELTPKDRDALFYGNHNEKYWIKIKLKNSLVSK
jgi:hypothetical protein